MSCQSPLWMSLSRAKGSVWLVILAAEALASGQSSTAYADVIELMPKGHPSWRYPKLQLLPGAHLSLLLLDSMMYLRQTLFHFVSTVLFWLSECLHPASDMLMPTHCLSSVGR